MDGYCYKTKDGKQVAEELDKLCSSFRIETKNKASRPVDKVSQHSLKAILEKNKALEAELEEVETAHAAISATVEQLMSEKENLQKLYNEKSQQDTLQLNKKKELENSIKMLSITQINDEQKKLLEEKQLVYTAVRNISQVKFSYTQCSPNKLEGFVFNKATNKVEPFKLNISNMTEEEIKNSLISSMKSVSSGNYADIVEPYLEALADQSKT